MLFRGLFAAALLLSNSAGASDQPGIVQVSFSGQHVAVVRGDGTVVTWDRNTSGRAVLVPGLDDAIQVEGSEVLRADGTVWNWSLSSAPVRVEGLNEVAALEGGEFLLKRDGTVERRTGYYKGPVEGLTNIVSIHYFFTDIPGVFLHSEVLYALDLSGAVWTVRYSYYDAPRPDVPFSSVSGPTKVAGLPPIAQFAPQREYQIALARDGSVWGAGRSWQAVGRVGPLPIIEIVDWEKVPVVENAIHITAEGSVSLATTSEGRLWVWGDAAMFGVAVPSWDTEGPIEVTTVEDIYRVWSGWSAVIVADQGGKLWGWGDNQTLGLGPPAANEPRRTILPVRVGLFSSQTTITMLTPSRGVEGMPTLVSYAVTSWDGAPSGKVRISSGSQVCEGPAPVGSCDLKPPAPGLHPIQASFLGDASHIPSSDIVTYEVEAANPLPGARPGAFFQGYWALDRNGDRLFAPSSEVTGWGAVTDTPVSGDWSGNGFNDVGVFSNGFWFLDLNGDRTFDPNAEVIWWGEPGWTPAPGDWNGDGKTELGVISPQSVWYRDLNGDFVVDLATESVHWGIPGSTPIVADWNGDGRDDLGVFQGGTWFIDLNGDAIFDPDSEIRSWGLPGWTPAPGDWDGDGAAELGVISTDSLWFQDLNGDLVFDPSLEIIGWGFAGNKPVIADWNGDGRDDIGVFSNGFWFLDLNGDRSFDPVYEALGWGAPGWTPLPGKWKQ